MREAQAEIKAIQAKLRSIQAYDSQLRQPASQRGTAVDRPSSDNIRNPVTANPFAANPVMANPVTTNPFTTVVERPSQLHSQPPSIRLAGPAPRSPARPQEPPPAGKTHSYRGSLADAVEQLNQRSSAYVQQLREFPPSVASEAEQRLNDSLLHLEAQAEYINKLATAQESAILELKAISEQVEQGWKLIQQTPRSPFDPPAESEEDIEIPGVCNYLDAIVPWVEKTHDGVLVLTTRSIDLFRAEREASQMAQTLRHRAHHGKHQNQYQENKYQEKYQEPVETVRRTERGRRRSSSFSFKEAVVLIGGAIVLRIGLNFVLAAFPGLWTPMILLLVTPVAIAVFRTPLTARSGFVWGARLLAVLLGLLIGGRL